MGRNTDKCPIRRPTATRDLIFTPFEQQFLFPGQVRGFFVQIKHTASIGAKCDAAAVWGPHRAGVPSRIEGEPAWSPMRQLIDPAKIALLGFWNRRRCAQMRCAFRPVRAPGRREPGISDRPSTLPERSNQVS